MAKKRGNLAGVSLRAIMTFALGAGAAMTATTAAAQDEADEIVVTATQRSTALQDVPVAVTPVTAEMIENSGIRDVQDLTSVAPSLQFNVSENESSATARLRGVGTQGSNPGLESAVGIFVDGVYRARNGVALSDLGEVQQIEVLRGPQGTLFGRNTSAGLITIATVRPDLDEFGLEGEATYGAYNEGRVAATLNIPLMDDTLGLRLFGARAVRDGFLDMNPDGANPIAVPVNLGSREHNDRDVFTLRGQLLWQMSNDADLRIIADYSERNETCCAAVIYDPVLHNGNAVQILSAAGVPGAPIAFGAGRMQWTANLGGYGPNVSLANPRGALGAGEIGDRIGFSNRDDDQNIEDYGVSGELNWDLDIGSLTWISSYRNWNFARGLDADFSQADLTYVPAGPNNDTTFEVYTHEVRLAGEWGRVDWLVGGFLSYENIDHRFSFLTGSQYATYFRYLDDILSGGTQTPGIGNVPTPGLSAVVNNIYDELELGPFAMPAGAGTAGSVDSYRQSGDSIALFTHNIISLGERTDLTVGLRFTHEEKTLSASFATLFDAEATLDAAVSDIEVDGAQAPGTLAAFSNCNAAAVPSGLLAGFATPIAIMRSGYCVPWLRNDLDGVGYNQSRSEDEWSGVLALRHSFTDNISGYISASRGYKGGGFNLDRNFSFVFAGGSPNTAFEAELVDAYELGIKTEWFNSHLIMNFAIYQNDYENFQLNTFNGIQFVVTTVPEVTSEGAELDFMWRTPLDGLMLQGGVAYTDAAYGPDCSPIASCGGWVQNNRNPLTGEMTLALLPNSQLTNAPEWTYTTALTYERPIFGDMTGLFYLDVRHVDDQNTGSDLRRSKIQPAYTLVNGRIGISAPDDRWSLELWGRNIFDEEYGQIMFDVPLQLGTAGPTQGMFMGDPATYGITLRARY